MDINLLLKTLNTTVSKQAKLIKSLMAQIGALSKMIIALNKHLLALQSVVAVLKNKKNSNNSHIPPSQDPNSPKANQSLRVSSGKKVGGQPGHEGSTLECSSKVDDIIKHIPPNCSHCGNDVVCQSEVLVGTRQLLDIPPIVMKCIEHQLYKKQCGCRHTM